MSQSTVKMNGAYSAAVDSLARLCLWVIKAGKPQNGFPAHSNFERTDSSKIVLTADKHSMGLSACLPIQRDGRRRSRPGASPFISALTVAVYPAIALMCGHNFGTFCPQVGGMDERRERPYTPCLLMKTALRLRLPAPQAQPVFLPLQMPLPSPAATAFETATPTERITHYTLLRKVVCQKGALPPLETPDNKTG